MADFSSSLNNFMYFEVLQCYEQLLTLSGSREQFKSAATSHLIEMTLEKVDALLHSENQLLSTWEMQTQVNNSLVLLKQQLIEIGKKQHHLIRAQSNPRVNCLEAAPQYNSLAQHVPVPKPESSESNKKFLDEVQGMLVTPRVQGLEDIAGLYEAKKCLTTTMLLPLYQPQLLQGRGISNTVLLFGPPGTGKSRIAHGIAAEMAAALYYVTSGNILSQYVGATERMMSALFQTVKKASDTPRILFMDEIDGLCQHRRDKEADWTRRLKTQLMCELTNFENCPNVYLIGATNCPWDIDPAFLRRFQRRLYIPLPNRSERAELLRILARGSELNIPPVKFTILLNKTEGYSGSDMTDMLRHALNIPLSELMETNLWEQTGDNAFRPAFRNSIESSFIRCNLAELPPNSVTARNVQWEDLFAALDVVKPTVSEADVKKYENFINKQ